MSDWDDDDFGGFESADVGNASDVSAKGDAVPAEGKDTSSDSGSAAQTEIIGWILSNTLKSGVTSPDQQTASSIFTENEKHQQIQSTETATQDASSHPPVEEQLKLSTSEPLDGHISSKNIQPNADVLASIPSVDWSKEFMEAKEKIQSSVNEETQTEEEVVDNASFHKLQSELDAALVMKEQSEKSLEDLKKTLEELTEKSKSDMEERSRQYADEISQLKQKHKDEIKELQRISEQAVKQLTNHYSDVWKMMEKDKSLEVETAANSVTEKCLELMKQQHDVLNQKLEESKTCQEKDFKKSMEIEQEVLNENINKKLEEGKNDLEKELNEILTERLNKEAKKLQEVHTETLKEAMSKQQAHFQDVLQSTLTKERERFSETLKDAVKDAQTVTEKEMERKRELDENRVRAHNLSLKMLLSSALQQLENHFPDVDDLQSCTEKT